VLDVGCGPGRFVSALNRRGVAALGVDVAETAVALTRGQGLPALLRSVFHDLPGEGRWPTVLLLDGNVGIGGDPLRLLERVRSLLRQGGRVLVEADADPRADDLVEVRFTAAGRPVGGPIEWAHVGIEPLHTYARLGGYSVSEVWTAAGRTFAALGR
jgi:SAM-dependent methyltransferase